MSAEEMIYYSNEEMMISLETFLENLRAIRLDGNYKSLLGEVFIDKLNKWDRTIRLQKNEPFTVVVAGDFKRGKSMLINAILQEEIAVTDVTPETVTLNKIIYGAHSNEMILSNGRRRRLSDEELKREELEKIILSLSEKSQRLELKRDLPVLKKLTIIDTPGLGDAMQDFNSLVKDCLMQADAVIYVFNCMYPLSMSERIFLRSCLASQKYTALLPVGNFADIIRNKDEYERVRQAIEKRGADLFSGIQIYMVSALDEICRVKGKNRPNPDTADVLEKQFDILRERIKALVESKADSVVIDRMQRLTSAMVSDLCRELDVIEAGLGMNAKEAARNREQLRAEKEKSIELQNEIMRDIDAQIDVFKKEASEWMGGSEGFLDRLASETKKLSEQSNEVVRRYYEVYCIDMVEQALTVCMELHQEQLYNQMDAISSGMAKSMANDLAGGNDFGFRFHLDNVVWTKGDTVGLALSLFDLGGFIGTLAGMAADGAAGMMRQKGSEDKKPELLNQIAVQMTKLRVSIQEEIDKIYTRFGESAKKLITEYYAQQLQDKENAIEQAIKVSMKEDEKKEELKAMVKSVREMLSDKSLVYGRPDEY